MHTCKSAENKKQTCNVCIISAKETKVDVHHDFLSLEKAYNKCIQKVRHLGSVN